jgi:hypothetical protein
MDGHAPYEVKLEGDGRGTYFMYGLALVLLLSPQTELVQRHANDDEPKD